MKSSPRHRHLRLERLEPRAMLSAGVGLYDPGHSFFYLEDTLAGSTDRKFAYGPGDPTWIALAGDWDGDGRTSAALYDPAASVFHVKNTNGSGTADLVCPYGPPGEGWMPLVGDWNGDGRDTFGLYDPGASVFYLRNELSAGVADVVFAYGPAGGGWLPVAGDWNGDRVDTPGLYDPAAAVFQLKDSNQTGVADRAYGFGQPGAGWLPVAGDWNGDGTDTTGLYDRAAGVFYLTSTPGAGIAEIEFSYGPAGHAWQPLAGAWQGAGAADPFTIVLLPDTQYYSAFHPEIFRSQTAWIAGQSVPENIALVTHVGDVVEYGPLDQEWVVADAAMDLVDSSRLIPSSVAPGNHDYQRANDHTLGENFPAHFGESRYAGRSWYGGRSADDSSHYQVFDAGGRRWLHLALEYEPRPATLQWAQQVLDAHPGMPTILTTHSYMSMEGRMTDTATVDGLSGQQLFEQFVEPNSQIFLVLCGHMNGERHQQSTGAAGQEVFELLADYQWRPDGGEGYLQLLRFVPGENRIDVSTYSPWLDRQQADANSQFSLALDFDARFGV